ncbi:MAG: ABC transporter substrate-binding protein [Beutenbergiaceae bacterium]
MKSHHRFGRRGSASTALALMAIGTLALAACTEPTSTETSAGTDGEGTSDGGAEDGYNVTMILGVSGDEGYLTDACGARGVALDNNITMDVQAADAFDPAAQIPVLQAAIATQPDAILIAPVDATALIAPIQEAVAAGIKVILFDTTLEDLTGIETVVGVDNAAGGQMAAEAMAEILGETGQVFVSNINPGVSTTDARQSGFEEGIAAYPGIEYLGAQYNNNDPQRAAQIASSMVTANPELAGIFGTNLFSVEGTVTGLRNADALDSVAVVGFDATPGEVEALQAGEVQALVAQKLRELGATAMQAAVDVLNGDPVEPEYFVGFHVITPENIDTPESQEAFYVAECEI